jgi:GxxExxY protein
MLIYERETYAILGACFEVYKDKGCGFLEAVYQECLRIELLHRGIPFEPEVALPLMYRGQVLQTSYRADFVCFGKIIIEIKAVSTLLDEHRAQLLNYLAVTGFELGMLINFGHYPKIEHERLANTRPR